MWKMNCGCDPPRDSYKETPIISEKENNKYDKIEIPSKSNNKIECLKEKIKAEYFNIIKNLECGIQLNLETLLEEISLVDILGYTFDIKKYIKKVDKDDTQPSDNYSCFSKGFWDNNEEWNNSLGWKNNI